VEEFKDVKEFKDSWSTSCSESLVALMIRFHFLKQVEALRYQSIGLSYTIKMFRLRKFSTKSFTTLS
jgi:hypothetical protein